MAKSQKGMYSPEAIQARQQQAVDAYNAEKKQAEPKPQTEATKSQAMQGYTIQRPTTDTPYSVTPVPENWDWRTAKVDLKGNPLQSRQFMGIEIKPEGFDPNGNPYFGAGGVGWLKKWAYKFTEEAATRQEADASWQKFWETSSQFSKNVIAPIAKDATPEERTAKAREQFSLFTQGASQLFDATKKSLESTDVGRGGGAFNTPLVYALRAANVAVGMTLEAFQFVSEVPERVAGAERAMRDYANQNSSPLPSLTTDNATINANLEKSKPKYAVNSTEGFKANAEAVDFFSRLALAPLQIYDQLRFITSPGSFEEKKRAVLNGWTEGRMLYTEIFKESVRQEYQQRVLAGDDPVRLVQELEDPWIEAGGEIALDPLNFLGLLGKAKKAGDVIYEAERVVEQSGLLAKEDFVPLLKKIDNVSTDAQGAEELKKLTSMVKEEATVQARRIASAQEYKATSFIPSANKIIHRKTMGNYISAITQAIRNAGGSPDDVLDYINAIRKFATGDEAQIIDGLAVIHKMPVQTLAFNDAAFEVGYMMNSVMDEADLIKQMQGKGGNFTELAKWFDSKMTKATDWAFPSIKEMEKASIKAKEAANVGELDSKTQRLSEMYKTLQKEHPGYIKWAQFQDLAEQTLKPVTAFLSNNYFSLSYGYAARNAMQNMFTLWVDGGLEFGKRGLASTPELDEMILKFNGGQMPEVFTHTKTFIADTTEGSLGNRFFSWLNSKKWSPAQLSQAAEIYAGKMVYVNKYRATMDKVSTFGGMFPELSKWVEAGFTESQAQDFIDMFRASNYDELATFEAYARKYGEGTVDKWRMLDWVQPEAKAGLQGHEDTWNKIYKFVNEGNPTQREVLDYIEGIKTRVKQNAEKVLSEPVRMHDGNPIAKSVMDDAAFAGKYADSGRDNVFLAQRIQADRAASEYETALWQYRDRLLQMPDPQAQEMAQRIFNHINPTALSKEREATLRVADEARNWVVSIRNRVISGENPLDLWDEAKLGRKPTGLVSKDDFLKKLWEEYYFPKRQEIWNNFYQQKLSIYQGYAVQTPELGDLFIKANKETVNYLDLADATYQNGKIYSKGGIPIPPPRDNLTSPMGHVHSEIQDGMLGALQHVQDGIVERWGMKAQANPDINRLREFLPDLTERATLARYKSGIVAEKWRDFSLLPYGEKTNMDLAMGLVYPYQFWYSRSYKNWMQRAFLTNPEIIANYANIKEAMANEQKDLPDWWKSQLNVTKLLGIETDNPMYINLEAAVFPLYGLTGPDFNDPQKRVNWWTSVLDDMGKFGPSVFAPLQLATALTLYAMGEGDINNKYTIAASKWGGRLIPQTATFKAVSSFFGKPIELDPAVQFFGGGLMDFHALDPYEEGRVARALAAMKNEGIPEQALIEAARTHEGPYWDEAYRRAVQQRAPGQIASFLLGTGFKLRSQDDIKIDQFYADYARMKNLHDGKFMTDQQYAEGFNKLREKYPFMDIVLLSRRSGMGRDAAYAYNVISRIPPGMTTEIYKIIGVDKETADKFYESGGDLSKMSKTEQMRFIAAMIDAGAMLEIPSNTTRADWTQARNAYKDMQGQLQRTYGEDIQDKISLYYGLKTTEEARAYLDRHPEVSAAMDAQTAMIVNNPRLERYYGGINTLERYYTGIMYDKLEEEFGSNITDIESAYFDLYGKGERKSYLAQHPELKAYWKQKDIYKEENFRKVIELGNKLPDAPELKSTPNKPENITQQNLQEYINKQQPTFQEWQQVIGQPMSELIQDYWYNNQELPREVESSLNYMASDYGFNSGSDMLQAIIQSMP